MKTDTNKQVFGQSVTIPLTIKAIKMQYDYELPAHWITDWLLYVIQKPAAFLITDSDYELTEDEQSRFESGVIEMQAGTPLAYLTGKQAFWSLEFEVNEHTLIPRPDTEVLVEQVLNWLEENGGVTSPALSQSPQLPRRLLDLGTGSGCIAISLAHELASTYPNQWQVTAIDYSNEALNLAKRNAQLNQVSNVEFVQSDWFSSVESNDKFAVIASNPPYIIESDEHLNQLKAEPLSALVAPDDGLGDIKKIVSQSKKYLAKGGLLAIEHGFDQGKLVRRIFEDNGYYDVITEQDYGGNDRVTMGVST